jgi:hypothetical protein
MKSYGVCFKHPKRKKLYWISVVEKSLGYLESLEYPDLEGIE